MLSYMIPLLTAPPQVPSLRFASGVPQGRRRAFGWHKSHPQAPPCVLRAGNRLLHPLIARRNFAVGTALCGNMRPYELGVSNRSEEHTSELHSLMRISYAVFCLKHKNSTVTTTLYSPLYRAH